ncbi:hypothetical protein PVAND_017854 [Polypedilum vanderplanki]|uniref:Protein-associating with the carboxyl-terminal domain of ezrin n=1 Tax=Polypedilum vanderplanki TaxID=319348 RepID=A0A9J6B9G3_POLVA|nr:hypothetical protein PVAND_017854 [Polypedilum vanderplanki]
MGADNSHMRNVSISEKQLVEKLKYDLVLFDGKLSENHSSDQKISIFEDVGNGKENPFKDYTLDRPLARAIKNLKIYRHPYSIIKFLASTNDRTLVTEFVIGSLEKYHRGLNELQVCLGIKNILNALIFLVETANVRHLNIAPESIFITENSTWKLAGAEHIHTNVTKELLEKSRKHRNQASIDPNENEGVGLEQYAFASLCETVIRKDSNIPFATDFLNYCSTHLKHKNASMRPLLSAVQLHNFFNHDFIIIHGFLSELPLKTQQAKQEFFKSLNEKFKQFDEEVVGSQLSHLLLSRLVLLDPAAQFYLLPFLLKPQNLEEDDEDASNVDYLFTAGAFVKFMVPKLKQVYRVLDVQIRLVLLEFFNLYINAFTKEELVDEILPQLLLGIRDTNDLLVTKTLLCLADLIPIVGANQVIGKNRQKIFADGRPQQTETWTNDQNIPRSITPINSSIDILSSSPVDHVDVSEHIDLVEKLTIDDEQQVEQNDMTDNEEEWNWEEQGQETEIEVTVIEEKVEIPKITTIVRPKIDDNIDGLDIKNKKLTKLQDDGEDFFSDFGMTPTFNAATIVSSPVKEEKSKNVTDRLQMSIVGDIENENEGWGDDNWDENDNL